MRLRGNNLELENERWMGSHSDSTPNRRLWLLGDTLIRNIVCVYVCVCAIDDGSSVHSLDWIRRELYQLEWEPLMTAPTFAHEPRHLHFKLSAKPDYTELTELYTDGHQQTWIPAANMRLVFRHAHACRQPAPEQAVTGTPSQRVAVRANPHESGEWLGMHCTHSESQTHARTHTHIPGSK